MIKKVYVLQHAYKSEGSEDENVKLIGVYLTRSLAEAAVKRLKGKPGFKYYPKIIDPMIDEEEDGFYIDEYTINKDNWKEGFVTI